MNLPMASRTTAAVSRYAMIADSETRRTACVHRQAPYDNAMPLRPAPVTSAVQVPPQTPDISGLLHRWGQGDRVAFDALVPLVYDRLREVARHQLHRLPGASLNTTGLVHEAWLKLTETEQLTLRDRAHFLAFSSRVMRNLLIDQARARHAAKRNDPNVFGHHDEIIAGFSDTDLDAVSALNDALSRLEQVAPRQSRILEQRFFGGLSLTETAEALDVSLATVKRELRSARAWLAAELGGDSVF